MSKGSTGERQMNTSKKPKTRREVPAKFRDSNGDETTYTIQPILMKKALWLQLHQSRPPETSERLTHELTHYKRSRFVPSRTPERAAQERLYYDRVKEWLRLPENRWCRVYLLLLEQRVPATQCHHFQGRRGMLLLYEPFWIPVSWEGHRWIDDHRQQARDLGLLCPLGKYNSSVCTE
jgi:hypothetical protein